MMNGLHHASGTKTVSPLDTHGPSCPARATGRHGIPDEIETGAILARTDTAVLGDGLVEGVQIDPCAIRRIGHGAIPDNDMALGGIGNRGAGLVPPARRR